MPKTEYVRNGKEDTINPLCRLCLSGQFVHFYFSSSSGTYSKISPG